MVPTKRSLTANLKELQQLRFCEQELDRRIEMQLSDAWYWEIKQKVTRYRIRLRERQIGLPPDQPAGELTHDEEAETVRGHSLLSKPPDPEPPAYDLIDKNWISNLRGRVLKYVSTLRGR